MQIETISQKAKTKSNINYQNGWPKVLKIVYHGTGPLTRLN